MGRNRNVNTLSSPINNEKSAHHETLTCGIPTVKQTPSFRLTRPLNRVSSSNTCDKSLLLADREGSTDEPLTLVPQGTLRYLHDDVMKAREECELDGPWLRHIRRSSNSSFQTLAHDCRVICSTRTDSSSTFHRSRRSKISHSSNVVRYEGSTTSGGDFEDEHAPYFDAVHFVIFFHNNKGPKHPGL